MGVAAFILAALTAVPYREVIMAAAIPAVAYFFCLFLSAVFQSRKQGLEAIGEVTPDMLLDRQDKFNLIMIFGPILLILFLSQSGILISTLYLMFLAVSIIDFCLNFTGLSDFIALDILGWLRGLDLGGSGSGLFQFVALLTTMGLAVLLGMGMPAVPAYINVALLMGPVLAGLGLSIFTAHMFIFYFAVASAITPPVAIAAFTAATITKAEPMATGFSAVRSGIVIMREACRVEMIKRLNITSTSESRQISVRWAL